MNNSKISLRTSTSQNTMIVALEPIEFIPCGRHAMTNHPGLSCLHLHQSQSLSRLDRSLIGSFSKVSLDDKKNTETWRLRKYEDAEEELYVCGHTVVWSRGYNVISTYTIDSPITQAVWCSFIVNGEDPHLHELGTDDTSTNPKKVVEGFSAVSDGSLHMFSREGDDYVTSLPFKVRKVWNCDFGLIFERSRNETDSSTSVNNTLAESTLSTDNALTTIFCLQHPLKEFAPVVKKLQGGVRYMNRSRESIIFCDENLVMTFDCKHGLHTIWKLRKITPDDVSSLENNLNQQHNVQNHLSSIRQMSLSSPGTSPMRVSYRGSPAAPILPNITGPSGGMSQHSIPVGLARTPHTSRNPSFAHLSHTPNSSRLCSPSAASINYPSHAFSPLRNSPHLVRSPSTPISHESLCLNDSVHESAEPLRPEICFEHVWSESVVGTREGSNIDKGMATKAFLSEDVCGQNFMAYIIDNTRRLRLVKYGLSNDQSQFIFGAVVSLPARDAAPLKELKMIAVLDMVGAITLYTGIVKLVKMHVTGVPMSSLSLSHGLRNATPSLGTPQPVSTPAHPSRPGSALGNIDEVGHLSPVPELAFSGDTDLSSLTDEYPFSSLGHSSSSIMGLPHVVGSTLLLEVSTGAHYKTEVPQLCTTSLVETCMKAMHHVLPNDIYLQITIKWYAMRHCPGAMASYQSEWAIFEACLREIIGYSSTSKRINRSQQMDASVSPVVAAKKARHFGGESSEDWEYLLRSDFNKNYQNNWPQIMRYFSKDETINEQDRNFEETKFELLNKSHRRSSLDRSSDRTTSSVQPLCAIFCVLHLVYEEQKLNTMTWKNIPMMSKFLFRLANDIGLNKFSQWYALDNPDLIQDMPSEVKEYDPQVFRLPACFSNELEPNVFVNLHKLLLRDQSLAPFPVISGVTDKTKHLFTIYDCLFKSENCASSTTELGHFTKTSTFKKDKSIEMEDDFLQKDEKQIPSTGSAHRALRYMMKVGITNEDLSTIPHGVSLPIFAALHQCKELPDLNFSNKAFELIDRSDLFKQNLPEMAKWQDSPLSDCTDPKRSAWQPNNGVLANNKIESERAEQEILSAILENDHSNSNNNSTEQNIKSKTTSSTSESADDNITRLLFPNDHRISEVRRLLQSSKPVRIDLTQQPGVSDHEFNEQLKTRLLQICNRTMSLAVGRGMVSLQTEKPVPTEPFQIPSMDLAGRCLPSNTTVDLDGGNIDIPPNLKDWPLFHNGVAAGLKIMPQMDNSSWIYLNKPKSSSSSNSSTVELSAEHAGFLLALGLNGHLEKLHTLNIHDYLSRTHEMTTVGLLLGLGASKCGSCDLSIMRLLSVHIPALLPQTSTEFDLPRVVQTAAVTAVGFLYLGSAQRLVAEVMLREIDRPPSPENDTGQGREAYALSCGIALGAITLGRGGNIPELADLDIPDQLFHYMTGRRRRSGEATSQSIILEGDQINTEITAPGAIMALTLMFLKTNNAAVADWFAAPETLLLLETIKPQHLMLRTLARSLILWDCVTPTKEWVESHIPYVIRAHITSSGSVSESTDGDDSAVDVQTILQCHASILTGACLALGVRFAGSQNKNAYQTLRHFVLFFLSIWNDESGSGRTTSYPLDVMGRYTLETCLTTCLLALSLVVAGSGDMETLQICRLIHVRLDTEVNYGMQMATHMALGFLFLGNCRKTLSTSNKAITALLSTVYPCFPCSSSDNQYHLQALRHFYVIAIEQRLLVPVDSATDVPCYARIGIKLLSESFGEEHSYIVMAPCMLPEINQLKEVTVNDPRHWPLSVDVRTQPEKIHQLLKSGLSVQRRTGFQPYIQDPKGHRSLLARSSDLNKTSVRWNSLLTDDNFNTSTFVEAYLDCFYKGNSDEFQLEKKRTSHLFSLLKNFLTEERTQSLHLFCGLQQICNQIQQSNRPNPLAMWQLKIASDFIKQGFLSSPELAKDTMNGARFIAILSSEVDNHFGRFLPKVKSTLFSLLELNSAKPATLRPRRGAKQKELTVDLPPVPPLTKLPWTQDVDTLSIWSLACYSVYNMLPSDFLFSSKKYGDCGKSFSKSEIMKALQKKGIKAPQGHQVLKAIHTLRT